MTLNSENKHHVNSYVNGQTDFANCNTNNSIKFSFKKKHVELVTNVAADIVGFRFCSFVYLFQMPTINLRKKRKNT